MKKKNKTAKNEKFNPKKAKKKIDILWSKKIRARDKVCRKCKHAPASQAAHIFGRGNLSTRWDEENGLGMCYYCHIIWAHREPVEFTLWVKTEIGEDNFESLRRRAREIYDPSNLQKDCERLEKSLKVELKELNPSGKS